MATPAQTDEAGRPQRTGGGGNVFTRKLGPAPLWVWMLAGLGLALGLFYFRKGKQQQNAAASTATDTSAQTPPFIIQNYTTVPAAGPGQPGPAGPPGPPGAPAPPPSKPPVGHPVPKPGPTKGGGAHQPLSVRVKPGDTLTSLAEQYHVRGGWQELYSFNTSPASGHTSKAIAEIKKRGPNDLVTNELIYIPQ